MIKNSKLLNKFEANLIRKGKVNIKKNFQILDSMYTEALMLGVVLRRDPLEGIEVALKIARVINNVSKNN